VREESRTVLGAVEDGLTPANGRNRRMCPCWNVGTDPHAPLVLGAVEDGLTPANGRNRRMCPCWNVGTDPHAPLTLPPSD